MFIGPKVLTGAVSNVSVSHYTMVRTISEAMGLPVFGQALYANPITDVWQDPVPARKTSWGSIKATYH